MLYAQTKKIEKIEEDREEIIRLQQSYTHNLAISNAIVKYLMTNLSTLTVAEESGAYSRG